MIKLIQKSLDWLKIEDDIGKSDVIFLFGSPSYDIPQKGFKLWKQKYGRKHFERQIGDHVA